MKELSKFTTQRNCARRCYNSVYAFAILSQLSCFRKTCPGSDSRSVLPIQS
ncbi:hypothetical protein THTE_2915 [Thermogutta terrifontis]|uniref:Uncharacterized protein n=1 Tax=Thermogutta terrifontis TaxID=1331910 RepID=A0A286RHT0_9BACT|nr:hypothetical protein THTE_2915 [Thermogutta terrifontis]